jgi:hypothetical protein
MSLLKMDKLGFLEMAASAWPRRDRETLWQAFSQASSLEAPRPVWRPRGRFTCMVKPAGNCGKTRRIWVTGARNSRRDPRHYAGTHNVWYGLILSVQSRRPWHRLELVVVPCAIEHRTFPRSAVDALHWASQVALSHVVVANRGCTMSNG